jgi:hypothetical protein
VAGAIPMPHPQLLELANKAILQKGIFLCLVSKIGKYLALYEQ